MPRRWSPLCQMWVFRAVRLGGGREGERGRGGRERERKGGVEKGQQTSRATFDLLLCFHRSGQGARLLIRTSCGSHLSLIRPRDRGREMESEKEGRREREVESKETRRKSNKAAAARGLQDAERCTHGLAWHVKRCVPWRRRRKGREDAPRRVLLREDAGMVAQR